LMSGDSVSRVYNYGDATATTAGQSGGVDEKDTYGLVAQFGSINAVSRKNHGTVGAFDIPLPLAGTPGIECRTGGAANNYEIVVTFPGPVTIGKATVTSGTGSVNSTSTSGNQVIIDLTGVTNAQTIQVTLVSVNNGTTTANLVIPMSVLLGDVNASGHVDAGDVGAIQQVNSQTANASNFRADVNASGHIDSGDVGLTQQYNSTGLPSPP
jgi:Dockerin type I domain